jgi:DMSO/TMAO reductase YedYZ molybdopterin-dependent catalytic subunit
MTNERLRAGAAGAVAAVSALAIGELVPALLGSEKSLLTAVGSEFIDRYAASLKELAVALFGTNDKVALLVGIVTVSVVLGAVLGVIARRHRWVLVAGFIGFGAVGATALGTDPQGGVAVGTVSATLAAAAGIGVYTVLARSATTSTTGDEPAPASPLTRRTFVLGTGAVLVVSAGMVGVARSVRNSRVVDAVRRLAGLPTPTRSVALPAATFDAVGVSPYITPVSEFYRIDTALTTPRIDPAGWELSITGMVDDPYTISYDELLSMDSIEVPVTIQCVSNTVGGDLVGTAMWQGVPLASILGRAGVQSGATQIVGRSTDGWTAGFPTDVALDGRTAIVAYAMNGEPLPFAHGFPARLVVSGLYGYVSATKWLVEIELTTWDAFDGYWVPRGWSKEGPIKLTSRIDVPNGSDRLVAGAQIIGGVAWSPNVGISAVEVQVDDGPWQVADLAGVASTDTWVQWRLAWEALAGRHVIRVRAIDADGATQVEAAADPAPNGATGWHTRSVTVA